MSGETKGPSVRLGRRGEFCPEVVTRILEALSKGMTQTDAFLISGISESAGWAWLCRGRKARELAQSNGKVLGIDLPFLEFLEAVESVQLEGKEKLIDKVWKDAESNVETAKWLLIKKFPKDWGDRVQLAIDDELSSFLADCKTEFPLEVYERILQVAARRLGGERAGGSPK